MGEKRNLVKRLFWLTQASICLHDIPKDAKIQHNGVMFSTFLDSSKISLKIMISDSQKYNGTPLYPSHYQKSDIMIFYEIIKKI